MFQINNGVPEVEYIEVRNRVNGKVKSYPNSLEAGNHYVNLYGAIRRFARDAKAATETLKFTQFSVRVKLKGLPLVDWDQEDLTSPRDKLVLRDSIIRVTYENPKMTYIFYVDSTNQLEALLRLEEPSFGVSVVGQSQYRFKFEDSYDYWTLERVPRDVEAHQTRFHELAFPPGYPRIPEVPHRDEDAEAQGYLMELNKEPVPIYSGAEAHIRYGIQEKDWDAAVRRNRPHVLIGPRLFVPRALHAPKGYDGLVEERLIPSSKKDHFIVGVNNEGKVVSVNTGFIMPVYRGNPPGGLRELRDEFHDNGYTSRYNGLVYCRAKGDMRIGDQHPDFVETDEGFVHRLTLVRR